MNTKENHNRSFRFQRNVAIVGIFLFTVKLAVWYVTHSDAVLSDALESTVNIIAAFMGLYSLYLAAKPKDENHPYGHGKVEFISAGIEGGLIVLAGIMIIIESFNSLIQGNELKKIDWGILIFLTTAVINYAMGYLSIKKGEKEKSLVLISSGKHLQSDTYTTIGVSISLLLVYFTKLYWIDAMVALIFGTYIIIVGYKIIRKSLSGIMDEADPELIKEVAKVLQENRKTEWIDLHNMKIQQYGSGLHIDAHITLPWYYSLRDAHKEMENVIKLLVQHTERNIEFNFHMDDCKPLSCPICQIDCPKRLENFSQKIVWNSENVAQVSKHSLQNANDDTTLPSSVKA